MDVPLFADDLELPPFDDDDWNEITPALVPDAAPPCAILRRRADATLRVARASDGLVRLAGWAPEDVVDDAWISFRELVHPDDLQPLVDAVARARACGDTYAATYRLRTGDGGMRWVREAGCVAPMEDGVAHVQAVVTDVCAVLVEPRPPPSRARPPIR